MAKTEKSIEKLILPENGKLIIEDGIAYAKILDEELDLLECSFNNADCVEIDTSNYGYITLSIEQLQNLIKLIKQAKKFYKNEQYDK